MMRIVAPLSSFSEAEMLLDLGADELYCGITTPEWQQHFGDQWWMNRRSPAQANLFSLDALEKVIGLAHAANASVHLTLNAPFYPQGSIGYLLKLVEKLVALLGIDGIIVSDVNLLLRLSREQLPIRIHLSSLGSCFNSYALDFYRSLGVKRIILPRQLRLSEIGQLVGKQDCGMEFEVFAVNDGCYFEEGFCQTSHAFGPFCLSGWKAAEFTLTETHSAPLRQLDAHEKALQTYLWYQNNCGSSFQAEGLPNGPCSLCWFGHFRDWGVEAVKIVGREASFYRKMRSLQLVKAVMDRVDRGDPVEDIAGFARSLRNTPEYCGTGYMCYFRDH